jgi:hypothetical protein
MPKGHYKGKVWISDKEKVIFLGIPKTASTSIRRMLGMYAKDCSNFNELKDEKKYDDYTMFTILRNPLERFVSGYLEVMLRGRQHDDTFKREFFRIKNDVERFKVFVNEVENDLYDSHIERQWYFVSDETGENVNSRIDVFLIFEKLRNDIKKLNLSVALMHLNVHSQDQKIKILNYLKQDTVLCDRINQIFAKDWELYRKFS